MNKKLAITYTFLFLFVFTFALSFMSASKAQAKQNCCVTSFCPEPPYDVAIQGRWSPYYQRAVRPATHRASISTPCSAVVCA
jgi:hypothetical protein